MSAKAKGRRTEAKVIDHYIKNGYIVDQTELGGRFRLHKDLYAGYCINCWKREEDCCDSFEPFGGFDLLAIKPEEIVLIQVKTNQPPTQTPYKKFAKKFGSENIKTHCATWYDRKGMRIQDYLSSGKIIEQDLRK